MGTWVIVLGVAVIGVLIWARADRRYLWRWTARRNQLEQERRWSELRAYVDGDYRTRRPFVRLFRSWTPGGSEIRYANELIRLGDCEAALSISERAVQRVRTDRLRVLAMATHALVLYELGRLDEARSLAPEIARLDGEGSARLLAVALAEEHAGEVDASLALLRKILAAHPDTDGAHVSAARILRIKGDFDAALRALDFVVSDGGKYYATPELDPIRQQPDFAAMVERVRTRHAARLVPGRLLSVAEVHIAADDHVGALAILDQCQPLVAANAKTEMHHHALRAVASALAGAAAQSDESLARMWAIVRAHPRSSNRHGGHAYAGLAALHLGRLDDARTLTDEALARSPYPLSQHILHFWLGEIHARAGRRSEACGAYERVIADGFSTVFHTRALAALGRAGMA